MRFSVQYINTIAKKVTAIMIMATGALVLSAEDTLSEAEILLKSGDTQTAISMLQRIEKKVPKNGKVNMLLGDCYSVLDSAALARNEYRKAQKKGENAAWLSFAKLALTDYRIDDAEEDLELYRKGLKKGRKALPDESEDVSAQLEKTRTMLDRVEKIVIIDSLNVDAEDFFTHYKLSPESGSILSPELLPSNIERAYPTSVYATETGNNLMWAAPDSTQTFQLVTTSKLYGGEWETPAPVSGDLGQGGDANYPFLLQDGITLYFANNSDNSLGGYDIYISRKGENGYLQPQNIGMPFNSPYNDYLLAIDETTGVGWWATDRNKIPGKVTIYIYIPSEMRINYDVDDPNLASYAKINSIRDTWQEDADYSDILNKIASIKPKVAKKAEDEFAIGIPGAGVYTTLEDFKSQEAKSIMTQYLSDKRAIVQAQEKLDQLRQRYGNGEKNLANEINAWEKRIANMKLNLKDTKNQVVKCEQEFNR